jgi:MoxR-like ATPase
MKKFAEMVEQMLSADAEDKQINEECALTFFVDGPEDEDEARSKSRGLSDFDAELTLAVSDDGEEEHWSRYARSVVGHPSHIDYSAAVTNHAIERTVAASLRAMRAALYALYAQRVAVLKGDATSDSLRDFARCFDNANEAYRNASTASRGMCAYAKAYAERMAVANSPDDF